MCSLREKRLFGRDMIIELSRLAGDVWPEVSIGLLRGEDLMLSVCRTGAS